MPQISIIVPVYKVEQYLDRCVTSILNQTFTDFELILVDDGSPDRCPQICDEWAKKDTRIRVIHKKNGGAGAARNAALKCAQGEYIGFVDSDDWIAANMYEYLYHLLQTHPDAQIAQCDAIRTSNETQVPPRHVEKLQMWNQQQMMEYFFRIHGEESNYAIWNKLIRRELLNGFSFVEGTISEDVAANFDFFSRAQEMVVSNQVLYFYFVNQNGVTKSKVTKRDLEYVHVWERIAAKVSSTYLEYAKINLARAKFTILSKMLLYSYDSKDLELKTMKRKMKKDLRRNFWRLIRWRMPISRKALLCCLALFPV